MDWEDWERVEGAAATTIAKSSLSVGNFLIFYCSDLACKECERGREREYFYLYPKFVCDLNCDSLWTRFTDLCASISCPSAILRRNVPQ